MSDKFKYAAILKDIETGLYVKQGALFSIIKHPVKFTVANKTYFYAMHDIYCQLVDLPDRNKFLTNKKTRAHKVLGTAYKCYSVDGVANRTYINKLDIFKYKYEKYFRDNEFKNKEGFSLRDIEINGLQVEFVERSEIGWKEQIKPNVVRFRLDKPNKIDVIEGNPYSYCRICGISVKNIPHGLVNYTPICYHCINNMKQKIEPLVNKMDVSWKDEVEQELFTRYLAAK